MKTAVASRASDKPARDRKQSKPAPVATVAQPAPQPDKQATPAYPGWWWWNKD